MEARKFVKEEPEDNEYYGDRNDRADEIFDSYSTIESEQQYDVEIEKREEFLYCEFESEELCDIVKIKREKNFSDTEENNNQNTWETASSCYPKLSIPLVRLENSKDQEVMKYLEPLLPAITSSAKLQSKKQSTELELNLKTECVELETLSENTLVQSPKNYVYASPWDFISTASTCGYNNSMKDAVKTGLSDNNGREYKSELFTCKSSSPRHNSNIQKTSLSEKKIIQKTLNFEVVSMKHLKNETAMTETSGQLSNRYFSKQTSKPQPRFSDSDCSLKQSFVCKSCDQKFTSRSSLTRHRHAKHGNEHPVASKPQENSKKSVNKCYCDVCGKPCRHMSELRKHRPTHDAIKRHECHICEKKFKMKRYVQDHIRKIHGWREYRCNYCERLYTHKATLQRHILAVHGASGTPNDRKYTPKTGIPQLKLKDKPNDDKATDQAPLKLYECDVCGERFDDQSSMRVHIEFLHIEIFGKHAKKPQPHYFTSSDKPFQCRTCEKRYTQLSHLYRHQETHAPKKSHICKLCDQHFTAKSSLSRHMFRKHDKQKEASKETLMDLTCKICSKVFTNLGDLRRHCAIHDLRKHYECDVCQKQFAVKGYLYAHMLTHDNWKPYPCKYCNKVYRRKSSLERHIDISHR